MYDKEFFITQKVGNNALSFEERKNKRLFVPSLKKISHFDEIELQAPPSPLQEGENKVVFEDFDFNDTLQTCYGLKNFYEMEYVPQEKSSQGIPLYLFDNHNHAYAFWYLARAKGIIGEKNTLYHVDEHADTRYSGDFLAKPDSYDLEKVFHRCNFSDINVGNYIIPAQKEGIIGEIFQIRSEKELQAYKQSVGGTPTGIILNLDLDFFQPDLDFIDFDLKCEVVRDIAARADLITVATSPFFIDQKLALEVFRKIFFEK